MPLRGMVQFNNTEHPWHNKKDSDTGSQKEDIVRSSLANMKRLL